MISDRKRFQIVVNAASTTMPSPVARGCKLDLAVRTALYIFRIEIACRVPGGCGQFIARWNNMYMLVII